MARRLGGLVLLAVLVGAACTADDPGSGPVHLLGVEGRVEVARAGASYGAVRGPMQLEPGDVVRAVDEGVARLRIGAATGELRSGGVLTVGERRVGLQTGKLLVSGDTVVEAEEAIVRTAGVVRIDRGLGLRVGAYDGRAVLQRPAGSLDIERLREAQAARGFAPRVSRPLLVSHDDAWDRRFLADHLELERTLEGFVRGLPGLRVSASAVMVRLAPGVGDAAPASTAIPELDSLVAASIASSAPGVTSQLIARATQLRVEGASWAVVSATIDADTEAVLSLLSRAIDEATRQPSPPARGTATAPAPPSPGTPGTPDPPSPGSPEPASPPGPTPSPDPCPGCGPVAQLLCDAAGVCVPGAM